MRRAHLKNGIRHSVMVSTHTRTHDGGIRHSVMVSTHPRTHLHDGGGRDLADHEPRKVLRVEHYQRRQEAAHQLQQSKAKQRVASQGGEGQSSER